MTLARPKEQMESHCTMKTSMEIAKLILMAEITNLQF